MPLDAPVELDAPAIPLDAPEPVDAPLDTRPADAGPCDLTAPFGVPVLVGGVNTADDETTAQLTVDERTLYFGRTPGGGPADIYIASRPGATGAFLSVAVIAAVNTGTWDYLSQVTNDERTMLLISTRGGTGEDVYVSTRPGSTWGTPTLVPSLSSAATEGAIWTTSFGAFLSRLESGSSWDLFYARQNVTGYDPPARIVELDLSGANEYSALVNDDETVMYFSSNRGGLGSLGSDDIWITTRASQLSMWGAPSVVASLSSSSREYATDLSTDGCRIYLHSNRPGGAGGDDLYVAARP